MPHCDGITPVAKAFAKNHAQLSTMLLFRAGFAVPLFVLFGLFVLLVVFLTVVAFAHVGLSS
jgi:hypothetical protein